MADGDVPPRQTIYINRLNEKIKKDGERSSKTKYPFQRPTEAHTYTHR